MSSILKKREPVSDCSILTFYTVDLIIVELRVFSFRSGDLMLFGFYLELSLCKLLD